MGAALECGSVTSGFTCSVTAAAAGEKPPARSALRWFAGEFDRVSASRGYRRVGAVTVFQDGRDIIGLTGFVAPQPGAAALKKRGGEPYDNG